MAKISHEQLAAEVDHLCLDHLRARALLPFHLAQFISVAHHHIGSEAQFRQFHRPTVASLDQVGLIDRHDIVIGGQVAIGAR